MVYHTTQKWSNDTDERSLLWHQWQKWKSQGMKAIQSADQIRLIMGVTNLEEYVSTINEYQIINQSFYLNWIHEGLQYVFVPRTNIDGTVVLETPNYVTRSRHFFS
jgi:hypothetical protein